MADAFEDAFAAFTSEKTEGGAPDDDTITETFGDDEAANTGEAPDGEPVGDEGEAAPDAGEGEPAPAAGEGEAPEGEAETPDGEGEPAPRGAEAKSGKPQESDDDILARFAELVQKQAKQPEPEPAKTAPEEEPKADIYSEEERNLLTEYEKDWPDVSKAETLKRRGEYNDIVAYVFEQIGAQMRPLMETVEALSTQTHLTQLHERVEDYDDVRENVLSWVEEQPAYLQAAYKQVIHQGTVDEVTDLIDRYRRDTGTAQAAPAPRKQETELPSATKQAAASLAPVSSKRSAIAQPDDPNDFASAFEKFAEKL